LESVALFTSDIEEARRAADARAAHIQSQSGFEFLSHRRWHALDGAPGETTEGAPISRALVRRVIKAYQAANLLDHHGASMWSDFFNTMHQSTHKSLMDNDQELVARIWENPADNYSFWGFDELHLNYTAQRRGNELGKEIAALRVYDNLLQCAMATGILRLENPEAAKVVPECVEEILNRLDATLGFRIDFPNPYPLEYGLRTSRGVASYRAIQALFQAYQMKKLVSGRPDARILEIGPGLGRSVYYAFKAGLTDYTLIDLPFSNVSQAFFLGTILGEEIIELTTENYNRPVKIITPDAFLNCNLHFDLVVNFDSFTEIDRATQRAYMGKIRLCADVFLSVNHEYNPCTVSMLLQEFFPDGLVDRSPYWMRRGYVQEIIRGHF
jgi:hypothetical protein